MRKILTCRLEYAKIHKVKNGHFGIECVAQYPQNTRERLQGFLLVRLTFNVAKAIEVGFTLEGRKNEY